MGKRLIIAGYSNNNLGDDLMFSSVINGSNYKSYYFCGSKINPHFLNKAVSHIKRGRALPLRWKVGADFALVGGSLFMAENDSQISMFRWKLELLRLNKFYRGRNYVVGANLGPYRDIDEYSDYLRKVDSLVDCWKVRDRFSEQLLREIGATDVEWIPDPVMGIDLDSYSNLTQQKKIAISVTNINKDGNFEVGMDVFLNEILGLIERYHKEGYSVDLLSFEDSEDLSWIVKIKNMIRTDGTVNLIGNTENKLLTALAEAEIVVSTRFHCMVLAGLLNKEQIIYPYSNKTTNFAESHGLKVYPISGCSSNKHPVPTGFDSTAISAAKSMFSEMGLDS